MSISHDKQAVAYFLDTTRMATSSYFLHFLDIIRSPMGKPLLDQLAASSDMLHTLLSLPPHVSPQVNSLPATHQGYQPVAFPYITAHFIAGKPGTGRGALPCAAPDDGHDQAAARLATPQAL